MSGYITFEERLEIESMIFQRCSFGEIAKKINKDRPTISREIRRHSVIEKSGYSGFGFNACVHKETCKMGMACGDNLTQEKINIMMNHINSYSRLKLGNKTPFEAFEFYYGSELFEKLGYKQVEKNQVIINPKLLNR